MPAPDFINDRLGTLRKRLAPQDAHGLLVTHPVNIRYLTGFVGHDSWAYIPLAGKKIYILSDFRYEEQIEREAPYAIALMRKKSLAETLAKLLERFKDGRVLLQSTHVSLDTRKSLAKHVGAKRLKPIDDGLTLQRAVKDKGEVKLIRKAIDIQQRAFLEVRNFIKPGMTENEVCAFLEYRMRALGADGPSFDSIVAVGPNSALPHAIPTQKKVTANCIVQFDWGAKFGGYCGDLSRVLLLGKVKAKLREIYKIVLEAQLASIAAVAPGVSHAEIDAAGRSVIEKAGYGERFGHGTGHGIGLEIHEYPIVSGRYDKPAKPGEVITIEPGIYLPGVGGVRIEDDVLVTPSGGRVLSDLPKSLESAII